MALLGRCRALIQLGLSAWRVVSIRIDENDKLSHIHLPSLGGHHGSIIPSNGNSSLPCALQWHKTAM